MKKIQLLGLVVVSGLLLSSCALNRTVSSVTVISPNVAGIETEPMIADLQIEPNRVTGEFDWDGKKRDMVNIAELEDNAVYNALFKKQADVLVAPQYRVVTEFRGGHKFIHVQVVGYPAKYENFRQAPKQNIMDVKELKEDVPYMIVAKDTEGGVVGYQVVVPVDKRCHTIDLDQTTLDKVVLNGNDSAVQMHAPKKVRQTSVEDMQEPTSPIQNWMKKIGKRDKKDKK